MSRDDLITAALHEAGLDETIKATRSLSGGCIHDVQSLTLGDGTIVVAKTTSAAEAGLLEEEARSLQALAATRTVHVPRVLAVVRNGSAGAVLLTSFIEPGRVSTDAWRGFGEQLAALHRSDAGERYGFDMDNHCGRTLQPNAWHENWAAFNRDGRIGHQVQLAESAGRLERDERQRLGRLMDRLDELLPARPHPALLHGDLWSGNTMPGADGSIYLIDPACSIGDGWADIALMRLFGGFDRACFDAYASIIGRPDDLDQRLAIYQLYHVLNHLNIFGRGYAGQMNALLRDLEC